MDACPGSPRKMKQTCDTVWPPEFGWFLWNSDFIEGLIDFFLKSYPLVMTNTAMENGLFLDDLHIDDGDFPELLQGVQWYPSDISIDKSQPFLKSLAIIPSLVNPMINYPQNHHCFWVQTEPSEPSPVMGGLWHFLCPNVFAQTLASYFARRIIDAVPWITGDKESCWAWSLLENSTNFYNPFL